MCDISPSLLQLADEGTVYSRIWARLEGVELSTDSIVSVARVEHNNPPYGFMTDSTILSYMVSCAACVCVRVCVCVCAFVSV